MNSESRRLIVAMLAAFAVFMAWRLITAKFYPPPPPPPPAEVTSAPAPQPPAVTDAGAPVPPRPPTPTQATPPTGPALTIAAVESVGPLLLGGGSDDALELTLDPQGGAVATLKLTGRNSKDEYRYRARPDIEEPYELLVPVPRAAPTDFSFGTQRVWIEEFDKQHWVLGNRPWQVIAGPADGRVTFRSALLDPSGAELLVFTKTYRLHPGKPVFDIELTVTNPGPRDLTIRLEQDGPLGIRREDRQRDMRKLLTTQYDDGTPTLNKGQTHDKLIKATKAGEPLRLLDTGRDAFLWTSLVNRYFGVYTRPLPPAGKAAQDYIAGVVGLVADLSASGSDNSGDLLARMTTVPVTLAAGGGRSSFTFEIYAGPKDPAHLAQVNPEYANAATLYYQLVQSADQYCPCTFLWLQDLMVWLLEKIHLVVRNYGIAIIILVIIVRALLHPLTVFQQKSMFRTQEAMGKMQPKMAALKEKYANDKTRLNQEMMKLWGEEGVNPAANMVAFIPLFLQMPILIALWTGLNTDVNLRHAAFLPWWITDLSAPDAFIAFANPVDVPILSAIPLLGIPFKGVTAINLLPILMGVSMWLQQKYMPKPHMQAKRDAAQQQAPAKKGGMTPEEQMRQQQMIAYMMSIMFPLMFYNMPSGLNLYWMATNVFGICESLVIRKQIAREKEHRERLGPKPPKPPGLFGRFFKHIASQAEELQRKADDLAKTDPGKKRGK